MSCTVLVVDDHAEFRAIARALLESDGFDVIGEACDGATALASVAQLRPNLVLLDVRLPDIDGFAVAEKIAGLRDNTPQVVLVSSHTAGSYRRRLATTSARGFLTKADLTGAALRGLLGDDVVPELERD